MRRANSANRGLRRKSAENRGLVYAVSLGCPKNRVDTEEILGGLLGTGFALCPTPDEADVVVINTCGFLREAREESLEVLREVLGRVPARTRVIAAGCMAHAFPEEIRREFPNAMIVGARDPRGVVLALAGRPQVDCAPGRLLTSEPGSAYLKVAEGCSRRCSFCIIPRIRGKQRSKKVEEVVEEARRLVSLGVRELVLVAQDLTHYGHDLGDGTNLALLVGKLSEAVPEARWIRLMYLFPRDISDGLLDVIRTRNNVLPYLDVPVQHINTQVLRAMRRGTTREDIEALVKRLRQMIPGVVLRTTFMVGFPGETEEAFEELCAFAKTARFEMAGVFRFSPEPGALAATMDGQVPEEVARERESRLQAVLAQIAMEHRLGLLGQEHEALVVSSARRGKMLGRLWFQAPEVDGVVKIRGGNAKPGQFVRVQIVSVDGNDFEATFKARVC